MDPKHFRQITHGGTIDNIMWKCLLCNSRATTNLVKHSNTEHHKAAVREIERRNNLHEQTSMCPKADMTKNLQMETDESDGEDLISTDVNYFSNRNESDSDSDAESINSNIMFETNIEDDLLGDSEDWYPFTKKESAKAKLQKKSKCKEHISVSVLGNPISTVGIEGLLNQELGNPLVSTCLEFYPEQPAGKNIYKLSQSKKWLQEYPRDLRAQMINVGGKHYYIYEPVQINDGSVVVPMFFYIKGEYTPEGKEIIQLPNPWRIKAEGKMIRHVPLRFYADDTSGNISKQWNKHISIFMSLAGLPPKLSNQEFNKLFVATSNIASALELAAPVFEELKKLTTTGFTAFDYSLQGDVLVLPVVLLFMADSSMHAEITSTMQPNASLMPCRICNLKAENKKEKATATYVDRFLGRKPTGYIIVQPDLRCWTATKNNAYHTWELVQQRASKKRIQWSITDLGVKDMLNQAVMKVIEENQDSRLVYNIHKINEERKQQLFNPFFELKGFDGHKDTPVEVLHVVLLGILKYLYRDLIGGLSASKKDELIARLQSFDTSNLNIQPIRAKYLVQHYSSLVGKDFKVLVQAAPFVFFPLIEDSKHKIWISLCHLCSFIFQTHITDLTKYMANLNYFAQDFLLKLISTNAQWVNKPKFHMLIHLRQSIARFGPTSLFATEKYESYNGVVRQASIHSNRQSPSHDIATSFQNYAALRFFFSGGITQAEPSRSNIVTQNSQVKKLLLNNSNIQKLFGFDPQSFKPQPRYPFFNQPPQSSAVYDESVPFGIKSKSPNSNWTKITSFYLDEKQIIKGNSFIILKAQPTYKNFIEYITGIWGEDDFFNQKIYLQCLRCEILEMDPFYGMRTLKKLNKEEFISAKSEISGVNVQHHCEGANCLISRTLPMRLERQETNIMLKEIHHQFNFNLYVINTASLRSQEYHHTSARIPTPQIQPLDALNAVHDGLSEWKKSKNSKGKNKAPESITSIDPSLT
ncbi:hypothetical protein BY996DRAFT_8458912 [Phakopsora pachyrhizi]|nr:hypothetical protein BY996DRAFT_8458912 [Phakopsora pachyrhizi]